MNHLGKAYVTTNLVGGLGNQMFLLSNLLATSKRCKAKAVLQQFTISDSVEAPRPVYWESLFENIKSAGVSFEIPTGVPEFIIPEQRPPAPILIDSSLNCLYNMIGFFQSNVFFEDYPILQEFIPARLQIAAKQHLINNYGGSEIIHRVGLHIRRGDYLRMRHVFEILELDYYETAVRQLLGPSLHLQSLKSKGELHLIIFCEEKEYGNFIAEHFRNKYAGIEVYFVNAETERVPIVCDNKTPREVLELLMLSNCDDIVMANSTWSWWAAYINTRPFHRIVAPSKWFVENPYPKSNQLYCKDWILL